ncbi:MAG: SNF2 helicase associated domain-containing protein [Kiritimatiellae bacterium]|nr:SNF2 helicase associated domain-containing protein [Kiritimatiellia bacterium]
MSPKDFTFAQLIGWGGEQVFRQAQQMGKRGAVARAEWNPDTHEATGAITLSNGREQRTGFKLFDDGHILSTCPCKTNKEFAMVCPHVVAIALLLMCRMSDPEAEAKHQAERRTAQRVAEIDPNAYIQRKLSGPRMRVLLTWGRDFVREFYAGGVQARLALVDEAGVRHAPEEPALREGVHLSKGDDNLLSVLEDICVGPATSEIKLVPGDFLNILAMRTQAARARCVLKAEYFEEDGQFELFPWAELPFEHVASADRFLVHGSTGFVWTTPLTEDGEGTPQFVPLANVLKGPFQSIYQHDEVIPRAAMPAFIRNNLPVLRQQIEVQMSPSEEFFRFVPDAPVIHVKLSGSRASLSAQLSARYGDQEISCGAPAGPDAICRPDPDDMLLYHVRNVAAEQAALKTIAKLGFEPSDSDRWFITEPRDVLNFLGSGEPNLRRRGWKITYSDRLSAVLDDLPRIVPVVDVTDAPGGAFDVGYSFEAGRRRVTPSEIQGAINRGDSYLMTDDRTYLLNIDAVQEVRGVFADCTESGTAARPGHFRLPRVYAPYVRGALTSFEEVDFDDEAAPSWRELSATRAKDEDAKFEPVDLGPLEGVLRPYQKQGVYWMRFLEKSGLSGLLADEMGLGKTLQTLTWISLERTDPTARGKPALVVCPTSLVQNWNAEAEKFTPWMKRLVVSGPDRAEVFARIPEVDLVITSYALLQRDLEDAYLDKTFSVIVLDEAQHIKNRTTRNAKSAKRLAGVQKLVLTGTPVENSVADVWSIFDFLLPDYLGGYDSFSARVEQPIACGGAEGQAAQERLRHKLHPFILRRLKKTVAKDLPDKIVKVAYCPMTPDQQSWYNRLLAEAKGKIGDMVKAKGFAKSKFEILALLMRLRQVACHLELLKEYREKNPPTNPEPRTTTHEPRTTNHDLSGKLDTFFELLDEAMDGGHRVLVFSQFVTMLTILRNELEARQIPYCYLDGSTKDRLGECRKFNTDESIPLFLISLHAGGTGLNLTGADMVVHFDPWWNPAVEDQATDRAHRIGQKRTVYVVKMIAENSVEERVLALQQKKQAVIDATVGTTDEQLMEKLTYDDIKSIVGL